MKVRIEKDSNNNYFNGAAVEKLSFETDLTDYLVDRIFPVDSRLLEPNGWTLTNVKVQKLLEKLRKQGISLGKYLDAKIFYGIKTGLNGAFVIDRETRNRLIAEAQQLSLREVSRPRACCNN